MADKKDTLHEQRHPARKPGGTQKITNTDEKKCAAVFLKAPEKGKVKTRLAVRIGDEMAMKLYMCFVTDILEMLEGTGVRALLFYSPPDAGEQIADWLGAKHALIPQDGRDLGERMENAFRKAFSMHFDQVILIGTDLPGLSRNIIIDAFDAVEKYGRAIGPASDGGYYLIGFSRNGFFPEIFTGVPWSTKDVFRVTLDIFTEHGKSVKKLPMWHDVDEPEDLGYFMIRKPENAEHTISFLERHRVFGI